MNIRNSSLDPNTPRGPKDCRVCNRRRIKCDRSLPSCKKCIIRKLECTGYDKRLKWDQGVASRGRFAGKATPVPIPLREEESSIASLKLSQRAANGCHDNKSSLNTEALLSTPSAESGHSSADDGQRALFHLRRQSKIDLSVSWSRISHVNQNFEVRRLIHHYEHHVAATFVWIDTPENRWRTDVLSLAQGSPCLQFAILALSSANLALKSPSSHLFSTQLSAKSGSYRDCSLRLLARSLEEEYQLGSSGNSFASVLATMYILCSLEMVPCNSAIWRVHLRAFFVIIRRWLSSTSNAITLDDTSQYLITQFSIINVFASTTDFDRIEKLSNVDFAGSGFAIFTDYLDVIHTITLVERESAAARTEGVALNGVDVIQFIAKLETARNSNRSLSEQLDFSTEEQKDEFERVIQIYHYSGLIYAHQALVGASDTAYGIPLLLACLLKDLRLVSTNGPFAQDISWPLFIAGTVCRHLEDEQRLLERLMNEEMEFTGFSNCQEALNFLRAFWCDSVGGETWIEFGRRHSKQREFLAL